MKYTVQFFRNGLPKWKRKKDPTLVRFFARPVSFFVASICANAGISANAVSIFSTFVGIIGCFAFLSKSQTGSIGGALIILLWLILDCVDGNLARSVKMQPYGGYYDSMSSYVVVGLLGVCVGYHVYCEGGIFIDSGKVFIVIAGAIASSADSLMRLCYQKYRNCSIELENSGIIDKATNYWSDKSTVSDFKVRLNMEMGLASFLPTMLFICSVFQWLDLVVIYMLVYYGGSCVVSTMGYMKKAWQYHDISMEEERAEQNED